MTDSKFIEIPSDINYVVQLSTDTDTEVVYSIYQQNMVIGRVTSTKTTDGYETILEGNLGTNRFELFRQTSYNPAAWPPPFLASYIVTLERFNGEQVIAGSLIDLDELLGEIIELETQQYKLTHKLYGMAKTRLSQINRSLKIRLFPTTERRRRYPEFDAEPNPIDHLKTYSTNGLMLLGDSILARIPVNDHDRRMFELSTEYCEICREHKVI